MTKSQNNPIKIMKLIPNEKKGSETIRSIVINKNLTHLFYTGQSVNRITLLEYPSHKFLSKIQN